MQCLDGSYCTLFRAERVELACPLCRYSQANASPRIPPLAEFPPPAQLVSWIRGWWKGYFPPVRDPGLQIPTNPLIQDYLHEIQ